MGNKNTKKIPIINASLKISDIPDAIDLHQRFIKSAGAKLGNSYLHSLYKTVVTTPETHLAIGAYSDHRLVGVITVTNNIELTDRLMNRNIHSVLLEVFSGIIRGRLSAYELCSRLVVHRKVKHLSKQHSACVLSVVVHPQFQGEGIGSDLFKTVYSRWKSKCILIDTLKTNVHAQEFYTKIGFEKKHVVADSIIYCKMNT